jgi:hypothetical protein
MSGYELSIPENEFTKYVDDIEAIETQYPAVFSIMITAVIFTRVRVNPNPNPNHNANN